MEDLSPQAIPILRPSESSSHTGTGTSDSQPRRQRQRGRRSQARGVVGIGNDDQPRQLIGEEGDESNTTTVNGEVAKTRNRRPRRRGRRGGDGGGGANNDIGAQGTDAPTESTNGIFTEPPCPRTEQAIQFIADSISREFNSVTAITATATYEGVAHHRTTSSDLNKVGNRQGHAKEMQTNRNRKKEAVLGNQSKSKNETNDIMRQQQQTSNTDTKKKNRKSRKKKPNAAPWREFIPQDLDDPISLEPLKKLPYPPFAIVVEHPYIPVWPGMWPPPQGGTVESEMCNSKHDEMERQISILREQWGEDKISAVQSKIIDGYGDSEDTKPPPLLTDVKIGGAHTTTNNEDKKSIQGRRVNLFDGRVLAYYLVSTLQFIDPYNRRDLTRPELEALDAYLAHHNLGHAGVVEAYDDKGVTISTAGRAAQSATGRAEILQQEARAILGSFFQHAGGSGGVDGATQRDRQRDVRHVNALGEVRENDEQGASRFQRLYAAQQGGTSRNNLQSVERQSNNELRDTGIYGGDGCGLLLIDDDINPGLRGGIPVSDNADDLTAMQGTRHSARHIAERHGHDAHVHEEAFPSLTSVTASTAAATDLQVDSNNGNSSTIPLSAPSRSLSKISNVVEKTDPKQIERQRKAREEALRRAELSKLSFFNPENSPILLDNSDTMSTTLMANMPPSEAVLERNRKLSLALGVTPSSIRTEPSLTGWARPVNAYESELEVNSAQYPDALLTKAKGQMTELLKLERRWNQCLLDDQAISCSLKPMDRPMRKFVHEYSDFWSWRTESFDPEGRRYVHCAKMKDTRAPHPLLSEAARNWRGPTVGPSSRDIDLALLPRGPAPKMEPSAAASTGTGAITGERQPTPRFAGLLDKERPKLQLAPRSIPTLDQLEKLHISPNRWNEMTPDQQDQVMREIEQDNAKKEAQIQREKEKEDARSKKKASKAKQKQDAMKKKKALLESAFISSEEENAGSHSDWSENEVVFNGSDDEAML